MARANQHKYEHLESPPTHNPPPPPRCPTNTLCNEHFRIFLGPNLLGTGFRYRITEAPNGVSNEHFRSDRVF